LKADLSHYEQLIPALLWLDDVIQTACAAAEIVYGISPETDPYRGLYISPEEMERLLKQETGAAKLQISSHDSQIPIAEDSTLAWIQDVFGLSAFDVKTILLALAPEIDLKYERIYAYLQDDVTRRRPSIDLALNLFSSNTFDKWSQRARFGSDAPLIQNRVIHLRPYPNQHQPPLLAQAIQLDEQIARFILGAADVDARLTSYCELLEPADSPLQVAASSFAGSALPALVSRARSAFQPLRLYFKGPTGIGKRRTAEALAKHVGAGLLAVDVAACLASGLEFQQAMELVFRHAWLHGTVLYFYGMDVLRKEERAHQLRTLLAALIRHDGVAILAGQQSWTMANDEPLGIVNIDFPMPDLAHRQAFWLATLQANGIQLPGDDVLVLASRFALTPTQIAEAAATAMSNTILEGAHQSGASNPDPAQIQPDLQALLAAARGQCGHALATLVTKIDPLYDWDDIVLPKDALDQLHEITQRVDHRHQVLSDWGFERKMSSGKGLTALFAGSSGTGKTMAAEVLANDLGLDLYKIDLSGIVSKYIGETEKNLDQIFTAARDANAILFFDEADALFGKRSKVRDSHDRYANIEISYLLQKMEAYDGVTILATNLRHNMDEAFVRRMTFTVHFPFPDYDARRQIWESVWPAEVPLSKSLNLETIAREYKLAGGNIKNIALASAFLAAEDGGEVNMSHLMHATRREYQKLGKDLSESELELHSSAS
jgi:AAA+ superfamily predicted ATPase